MTPVPEKDTAVVAGSAEPKRSRRRTTFACARCHRRKIRCDNLKPTCTSCRRAGSECLGILDGQSKTVVPRSVVKYLQDAIAEKEVELQRRHISVDTPDLQRPALNIVESSPRESQAPRRVGTGWLSERFVVGSTARFLDTHDGFPTDLFLFSPSHLPVVGAISEAAASMSGGMGQQLPEPVEVPHNVAEVLVKNYINNILPLYPFLDADDLWARFRRVYRPDGATALVDAEPHDVFITKGMLCVSIMSSRSGDTSQVASSSERVFRQALGYAQHLFTSTIQNLQGIVLLTQYSYLMPRSLSIWETARLSMRMAVELGLHRDPSETAHVTGISEKEANFRRSIFWCVYEMERSTSIASRQKVSIADDAITTKYPTDKEGSGHLCVVRFRQLQAEILTVNYLYGTTLDHDIDPHYVEWVKDMEAKIISWKENIVSQRSNGPEWYDIAFWHAIVFLHRPSPRNPSPTAEALAKCFEAATEVATGYWEHAHSGFLKYSWHAVHHSFESAIVMLYALRKCKTALREKYGIRKTLESIHLYSSLFVLLSERWQKATSCYQTYERLKTQVLMEILQPESQPWEDVGDELDQLVMPPDVLARIGNNRRGSNLNQDNAVSDDTETAAHDPSMETSLPTAVNKASVVQSASAPAAWPVDGLGSAFWNDQVDLLGDLDWQGLETDEFNEQSFMLWNM